MEHKRYKIEVHIELKEIGTYSNDTVVHAKMDETVPEEVDPIQYLKGRVHQTIGRKLDTEIHILKALPKETIEA